MSAAPDLAAMRATGVAKYLGAARPNSSETGAGGEVISAARRTGTIISAHRDRVHRLSIDGQQHTTASTIHAAMVNGAASR